MPVQTFNITDKLRFINVLSYISIILIFLATIFFSRLFEIKESNQIKEIVGFEKITIEHHASKYINEKFNALERMAFRWIDEGGIPKATWERDAKKYIEDQFGYQALEWVDKNFIVQWVIPIEGNEQAIGLDLSKEINRNTALQRAYNSKNLSATRIIDLVQGKTGFLVFAPIYSGQDFDGFILGVFNTDDFFSSVLDSEYISQKFNISVHEGSKEIYRVGRSSSKGIKFNDSFELHITDIPWRIIITPNDLFVARHTSDFSSLILFLGLTLAAIIFIVLQAIHYRNRQQQKLLGLEAHSSAIVENVIDGIITIQKDGKISMLNKAAEKIFGYREQEVLGKNIKMLMPEPYSGEHDAYLQNYLTSGEKKIIGIGREVSGLRKDGTTFPMELSVSEVNVNEDIYFTGIVRDISERKQAEQELALQKEYYENLFHDLNVPVFMLDRDHKVIMWNKACENMTGARASDVMGTNHYRKYIYKEDYPVLADFVLEDDYSNTDFYPVDIENSKVSGGKRVQNWVDFPYSNRPPIYLTIDAGPVYDKNGKKIAVIQVMQDITSMKNLESIIEENKKYYESLISNLDFPTFVIDKDHKVITWNRAQELLTGLSASEVLGTNQHWRGYYKSERPCLADLVLDNNLDKIEKLYEVKMEHPFKPEARRTENWCDMYSGEKKYIDIYAGPIYDENNNILAVIEVTQDITQRKKAQEKLEKYQTELERSNKELEQFAYIASHDLQEPLRMISSYTQLLSKRYKDKLGSDANEFIDYAVDGASRMQQLVQDLLQYSRLNTREKENVTVNTNDLVQYAIENLALPIDETGTVVTSDELPNVIADIVQLRQLFQNLIGNAIKYRDPEKLNKIHVSANKTGDDWQFCIEDNGIGIESKYFEKIFVIFKRLHNKQEYQGTGIGLAICKKIIENHGGRIWLESEPGVGSRFYFTLPAEKQ